MYLIWVFLSRILKRTFFIFEMSTLKFAKINKIKVKPKKIKFGTKIPINLVHLDYNLKKLLSYLKSTLLSSSDFKFLREGKNS